MILYRVNFQWDQLLIDWNTESQEIINKSHPQNQEQIDTDSDANDANVVNSSNVASELENSHTVHTNGFREPFPHRSGQVDFEDNISFHTIEPISSQQVVSMCQMFSQKVTTAAVISAPNVSRRKCTNACSRMLSVAVYMAGIT